MRRRRLDPYRDRRPPAVLMAALVSLVAVTGGCSIPSAASRAAIPVATTSPTDTASPLVDPAEPSASPQAIPTRSPTPTSVRSAEAGGDVVAVGDSIMVDAMPNLRSLFPGIATDALAGRQVAAGLSVLQTLAVQGRLQPNVVIELGTNGTFTPAQMDRVFALAAGRRLVLLTNHCGYCAWVPSNNALMAARCNADYACTVADWETLATAHPEWFAHDGVHMPIGGVGGEAFAQLIARSLGRTIPAWRLDPALMSDPPPDRPLRGGEPS